MDIHHNLFPLVMEVEQLNCFQLFSLLIQVILQLHLCLLYTEGQIPKSGTVRLTGMKSIDLSKPCIWKNILGYTKITKIENNEL